LIAFSRDACGLAATCDCSEQDEQEASPATAGCHVRTSQSRTPTVRSKGGQRRLPSATWFHPSASESGGIVGSSTTAALK
jgi:hypothetical protein